MVDLPVSIRLRRAILLNDVLLVKRILRNNPTCLNNTDFEDKSNTSLHLAAIVGHLDIIKLLVEHGHDSCEPNVSKLGVDRAPGISLNTDSSTPLHLAALNAHPACTDYLCTIFPQTIEHQDKNGATPLMLAAQSSNPTHTQQNTSIIPPKPRPRSSSNSTDPEDTSTITVLLNHNAPVDVADYNGNTVLHYASTWGNLKAFRLLVGAGAPPFAKNNAMCTAADYALSIQAAVYCRSLIAEFENFKNGGGEVPQADQQMLQQRLDSIKPNLKVRPSGEFGLHVEPHMASPISPTDARLKEGLPSIGGSSPRTAPVSVPVVSGPGSVRLVAHDDGDEDDSDVASSPEYSGIMRTESIDVDSRSRDI